MSYRIEYDGREGKYEIRKKQRGIPVFLGILVIPLGMLCLPQDWRSTLVHWIIPGPDAVTVQAFHTVMDDLRSGARISEALDVFCRFVIHGQ